MDTGFATEILGIQRDTLELVVTGAPLDRVLNSLAKGVEQHAGGAAVVSILLLDDDGLLRNGALPSLPAYYLSAIDRLPAREGLGTCAWAAATGEVVITPSFAASSSWDGLSHYPLSLGLLGAWSMPIRARDGRVLGTFGTYFREVRGPTAIEKQLVEVMSRTAAIAIEGSRREESQMRSRLEAESANLATDQFITMAAHELRTPLDCIIAYADMLRSRNSSGAHEQNDLLARITAGARHLGDLVSGIIAFVEAKPGFDDVHLEIVDLKSLVEECADLIKPQAQANFTEIRLTTPMVPLRVVSDARKLRRILLNLTANSMQLTREGRIALDLTSRGAQAVITVTDTGRGMQSAEEQQREGIDVGIALCHRLSKQLGSELTAISVRGGGSTFTLALPLAGPAPRALEDALLTDHD